MPLEVLRVATDVFRVSASRCACGEGELFLAVEGALGTGGAGELARCSLVGKYSECVELLDLRLWSSGGEPCNEFRDGALSSLLLLDSVGGGSQSSGQSGTLEEVYPL